MSARKICNDCSLGYGGVLCGRHGKVDQLEKELEEARKNTKRIDFILSMQDTSFPQSTREDIDAAILALGFGESPEDITELSS